MLVTLWSSDAFVIGKQIINQIPETKLRVHEKGDMKDIT